MDSRDFTYAVSRIRIKETKLFSKKDIDRLLSQKDYPSTLRALSELGFSEDTVSGDDMLLAEQNKLWSLMAELVDDMRVFDVFRIQNDFHNLKVSVKCVCYGALPDSMLISGGTVEAEKIYECVKNRSLHQLPRCLSEACEAALNALIKTGDGQLCDIIIDREALNEVYRIGKSDKNQVIRDYARLFVAAANIKTAVRGARLNKSYDFFQKAIAECDSLDKERLSRSGVKGLEDIFDYLSSTEYKDGVLYIKKSMSSFEKWCDDLLIKKMKSQKSEPFNIGPLVAYIVAKQNEIKTVRLILIAKLNGIDSEKINERIREMYV